MDFIFYIHLLPLSLLLRLGSALDTAQSTPGLAEDLLHREEVVFFILGVCGKAVLPTSALRLFRDHSVGTPQSVGTEGRNDLRHIFLMFSHFLLTQLLSYQNELLAIWLSFKPQIQSGTSNESIWSETDEKNSIKIQNHRRKGD